MVIAGCEPSPPPAGTGAPQAGQVAQPAVVLAPWTVTVAPGVRLLGGTFPNACYVIETSEGLALVDTCSAADASAVIDQINAAGMDLSRLKRILLTHVHGDHSLGARRLRELTGAKVYAGRGDCDVLRAGGPREAFFSTFDMQEVAHPTPIDVELAGGETVEAGDTRFGVIATPGHTPGSVCYLLERDGLRILFTGDVVASLTDTAPLAGPGIYPSYLSPRFRGDAAASLASLRALLAMPAPDLVLPGHPRADASPQDPHIPRAAWETLLKNAIGKLELLLERRGRDGANFLDGVPKQIAPGLCYFGESQGFATYGLATDAGDLYLFGAPDVPDPADFVRRRCEALGLPPATKLKAVCLTTNQTRTMNGLRALVEATGCAVVAPRDGLADVSTVCPEGAKLVASEDLPALGWFPVETLPIAMPGTQSVGYVVTWRGKVVAVPGRFPAPIATPVDLRWLRNRFATAQAREDYLASLDRIGQRRPDVWLPLVPLNDQSANIYDDDWKLAVESNRAALK